MIGNTDWHLPVQRNLKNEERIADTFLVNVD